MGILSPVFKILFRQRVAGAFGVPEDGHYFPGVADVKRDAIVGADAAGGKSEGGNFGTEALTVA